MFVYNDPGKMFVNGSTGKIIDLTNNYADVRMKDKTIVRVGWHTWISYQLKWNKEFRQFENIENGRYTQMPLIPAYAITCHKAQGKTLDSAYLECADGQAFASGQTYVAISRVRAAEDLTLSRPLTPADIPVDPQLEVFAEKGLI